MTTLEICRARSADEVGDAADRAAAVLERGGLLVYPTETVYGLGGDGTDASNRAIGRIKGWHGSRPMILLIPSVESLGDRVEWTGPADRLARRFWPGALTLIVRARSVPAGLIGSEGGVAVRVSPHPVVRAILERWGRPLTSTSANRTGRPAARTFRDATRILEDRADLRELDDPILGIDGGPAWGTVPSTIVSVLDGEPRLVREGPIAWEELAEVLSETDES